MKRYKVSLVPTIPDAISVTPREYVKVKKDKAGNMYNEPNTEFVVNGMILYTWVNDENPEEKIEVQWFMTGSQSDPAQAFGGALTYAERYFLLQYFQIATPEDDPDAWRGKQTKAAVEQMIQQIKTVIDAHLSEKPADRDKIAAMVGKYVKDKAGKPSSNYYLIATPEAAERLLEELATLGAAEK